MMGTGKPLGELLHAIDGFRLVGTPDRIVRRIEFWDDDVGPGDLFVAIRQDAVDGRDRIGRAIAAGARTILCRRMVETPVPEIAYVIVDDPVSTMGYLAHAFHDFPSRRLRVIGVTGTNGKTTTATLLHRLFRTLGHGAGLLSNIGDYVDDRASEPRYTTGHALFLSAMMARMVAAGCEYCFMEVSSQAIPERRVAGVAFAGAIFTNLTRDHLDYHGSFEQYARAKKSWFDALPAHAFALANGDDPRSAWMLRDTAATRLTYGTRIDHTTRLRIIAATLAGLAIEIDGTRLQSSLLGSFNAYNLAAVYAAARRLGITAAALGRAMGALQPVAGRMQAIRDGQGRTVIIDYAHTPDAVEKVLGLLGAARPPGGRVITVIGCGGGGDPGRRPIIAATAAAASDRLILTSDNPRDEDPAEIVAAMAAGLSPDESARTDLVPDRRAAIAAACAMARGGDVVLVAGKGHERYQEIRGVRHPFDDVVVARTTLGLDPLPGD